MNTSAFPNGNRPDGSGTDSQNAFSSAAPCPQAAGPAQQIPAPVLLSDLHAHRAGFSRIGASMLMLLLGCQLFAFLVSFAVGRFAPDIAKTWWYSWVLTDVSLYGIGLPLMWLILRQVPAAPFNPTYRARGIVAEKPRFGFGWWILIAVIGMGAMQIGALVGQGFMKLLSYLVGYDYANGLETIVSGSPLWATFLGTVVLAPLGEEFIFRKLLIDRTRRWGDAVSVLLSGILFGLFHGNLFQLFYTTMFGFLLAYIYTRTGRLGWCVGLHALTNFWGGIVPTLLRNWIGTDIIADPEKLSAHLMKNPLQYFVYTLYGMIIYALMIAAVVLLICLRKKIRLGDGSCVLPAGRRFRTVVLNVGMTVALLAFLLVLLSALILPPLAAR